MNINVIKDVNIAIEKKSFFLLAIIYKFIHIAIKIDINKVTHIIHCSKTICINQFSGKNL
jgi:hypothetical protein